MRWEWAGVGGVVGGLWGVWWMCVWRSGSWFFGTVSCFILVVMYVKLMCEVLVMVEVSLW